MTDASDTPRPDEMTDDQLDQTLQAASADLLRHITATADPNRTLTAIMASAEQPAPAETRVSIMIRFRDAAHDIARILTVPLTSAGPIDHVHQLVASLHQALIPDRASDPVRILERTVSIADARVFSGELLSDFDTIERLACARAYLTSASRTGKRELAVENVIYILDQYLHLHLDYKSGFSLKSGLDRDGVIRSYIRLGRDVARDIDEVADIVLASAGNHARALVHFFDSQELDASGVDLSGIVIRHLDAVDGITWTCETTWPPAITSHVEEHSYEIRPGVYQVRLGDTRDRHMLLAVT